MTAVPDRVFSYTPHLEEQPMAELGAEMALFRDKVMRAQMEMAMIFGGCTVQIIREDDPPKVIARFYASTGGAPPHDYADPR